MNHILALIFIFFDFFLLVFHYLITFPHHFKPMFETPSIEIILYNFKTSLIIHFLFPLKLISLM